MKEFYYNDGSDEPKMFTIDADKQNELNETMFQFLRDTGISEADHVTSDLDREEAAMEFVEAMIEILEIENADRE